MTRLGLLPANKSLYEATIAQNDSLAYKAVKVATIPEALTQTVSIWKYRNGCTPYVLFRRWRGPSYPVSFPVYNEIDDDWAGVPSSRLYSLSDREEYLVGNSSTFLHRINPLRLSDIQEPSAFRTRLYEALVETPELVFSLPWEVSATLFLFNGGQHVDFSKTQKVTESMVQSFFEWARKNCTGPAQVKLESMRSDIVALLLDHFIGKEAEVKAVEKPMPVKELEKQSSARYLLIRGFELGRISG